jgi:Doubled CXXCH motif (Paired_CXXCH_1)
MILPVGGSRRECWTIDASIEALALEISKVFKGAFSQECEAFYPPPQSSSVESRDPLAGNAAPFRHRSFGRLSARSALRVTIVCFHTIAATIKKIPSALNSGTVLALCIGVKRSRGSKRTTAQAGTTQSAVPGSKSSTPYQEEIEMKKVLITLVAIVALSMMSFAVGVSDPLLGPHNLNGVKGCTSCHSPHNGSSDAVGAVSATARATGATYLWANVFDTNTFSTFAGGTLVNGTPKESDPNAHSVLCMSCHDSGISTTTMGAMAMLGTDLTSTHPVDVKYGSNYDWQITIAAGRASFTDVTFAGAHSARLYVDAAGANAYVECSSCHNPHAWQNAVVTVGTTKVAKATDKFVRGWYDPADGASQAQFCRGCHYSKSSEYVTYAGAVK